MKKWLLGLMLMSCHALAGSLTIPYEFRFQSINGTPIATSNFSHKDRLALQKGPQIIALTYQDIIEDDITDSTEIITSKPFYLHFNHDGLSHYQLLAAGKLINVDPKKYALNPQVTLVKPGKEAIAFVVSNQAPQVSTSAQLKLGNDDLARQMLEYWWQQASPKTKQQFKNKYLQAK
ncbi:DUF2057 family protein [Paraferrimonas sp. SM1919]|uniref:DUF2057 family protein n=1 Tax=Paraferrimonas sp. SM1919 TaxID=2662263 RepID=UPI0013D4BA65|nr:DUF2057 family protein [Paraferrimonas sp. SM1919]